MPAGEGRQPVDAGAAAIVADGLRRAGARVGRRVHCQEFEDAVAGVVGLHRRSVRLRRFSLQRPLDGACDRPGEGSPRDAAARRVGSRRRLRVQHLAEQPFEMALLARTVSAGRVDPPAQQEPFPDDRRASRGARDAHPRLPHAAGAGRGGQIRSRDLLRRHRFRAYRRGVARRQGARAGLHEQHAGEIQPVRQIRERPRDDSPHGGGGDRLFRRLHPQQRAGICAHHRDDRRGDSLGVRQFDASLQAARGAERFPTTSSSTTPRRTTFRNGSTRADCFRWPRRSASSTRAISGRPKSIARRS